MEFFAAERDPSAGHNCYAYRVRSALLREAPSGERRLCAASLIFTLARLLPVVSQIGNEFRFSDDGEPGGTAGRPILSAIEGSGLDGAESCRSARLRRGCALSRPLPPAYFPSGGCPRGPVVRGHQARRWRACARFVCDITPSLAPSSAHRMTRLARCAPSLSIAAYSGAAAAALRDAPTVRVAPRRAAVLRVEYRQIGAIYKLLGAHGAVRTGEEFLDDGSVRIAVEVEASLVAGAGVEEGELHSALRLVNRLNRLFFCWQRRGGADFCPIFCRP